jgi:excisionase family DNA binding protein
MTTPHETHLRATFLASVSAQEEDAADLDRILGDDALFRLNEVSRKLRISMPTLYRGMRMGRIPFVRVGSRRALTRPVLKRLLREGMGQIA